MPLPSFRFLPSKCPWFFIRSTVADCGSTVFHEEEKKKYKWWEMSSSYFCCSSWTPSSLWTRRTPPVSKVLWRCSCKHTPLGVNIHLKKQGAPHQKCLYKCKHIWFLEKCHSRYNWCVVPSSGECWENTKQSSPLPNQTLSPIASLLPSSDPSCLLGQPSLQPCQQIHWQV